MCGITGWYSVAPLKEDAEQTLHRMNRTLVHRGPDGDGFHIDDHIAFGHTRLAIIDLDSGHQPMWSANRQAVIVFNGEIYNYKELRKSLITQGYSFSTESDTEVILNLYLAHGLSAFSFLRGMYAVAIWDKQNRCGVLARDPIGIKPLFFAHLEGGGLVFASEVKAILESRLLPGVLCEQSLHLLMNFRYIPGDDSLFRDIRQLAPGTVMRWDTAGLTTTSSFEYKSDRTSGATIELLEDAVGAHLTADVEVATYLSGGIDSASITALAKKRSPTAIRTFTLDAGDDPREAVNAARTAELLGVANVQGTIDQGVQDMSRLIWHLELPKINAYQVNQVARHASQAVKVALSGLGGDELFLGYEAHRIIFKARQLAKYCPPFASAMGGHGLYRVLDVLDRRLWSEPKRVAMMLAGLGNWPRVYGVLRNVWDSPALRKQIYGPRMLDQRLDDAYEVIEAAWPDESDPLEAMRRFEWRQKMVNDLLWQEDRCSMAEGLEARVPFLDLVLAGNVARLPVSELMPGGDLKGHLRHALSGLLPAEVLNRPKSGFQVDAQDFYHTHLARYAADYLSEDRIRQYGLFNPQFVSTVLSYKPGKDLRWHYFMLYLMITTHLWLELFENKQSWQSLSPS